MESPAASQLLKRYTGEHDDRARFPTGVVFFFLAEAKTRNPRVYDI